MEIKFSENAEKQLRRFKKISAWDVQEFVEEEINQENFQDYLNSTHDVICTEFYDRDNKVIIYTETNFEHTILEIQGVMRVR